MLAACVSLNSVGARGFEPPTLVLQAPRTSRTTRTEYEQNIVQYHAP